MRKRDHPRWLLSGKSWLLAALLAGGLGVRLAIAWLDVGALLEKTLPDDAFYYFAIARNLSRGSGFTVDGLTQTNGFHPLWALLLVPCFWLFSGAGDLPIHVALSLAAALDVGTTGLVFLAVRRGTGDWLAALIAAFLYAFNPAVILQSVNGLETSLNMVLWAAFFHAYLGVRESKGLGPWSLLGVLGGFTLLARTDSVFLLGFVALDLLRQHRSVRSVAALGAGTALPLIPWLGWNQATFGTWLQSSGVAIPYVAHQHYLLARAAGVSLLEALGSTLGTALVGGFLAFWQVAGVACIGLVLAWGVLFFYRSRLPRETLREVLETVRPCGVSALAALALLGFHVLYRWYPRPWYVVPLGYSAALLAGPAVRVAGRNLLPVTSRWRSFTPGVVAFLALVMSLQWGRNWPAGLYPWQADFRFAAQWASRSLPKGAVVGAFNAGVQGYYGTHTVVNLDGVVDPQAYQAMRQNALHAYALQREVGYLIDHRNYVEQMYAPFWGQSLSETLEPMRVLGASHPRYGPLTVYRVLRASE
ncbi:MAG: hypothetical protein ACUVXG_02230 [Anaerolineae bacterium]